MSPLPVPVARAKSLDGVTLRGVRPHGGPPRDITIHNGRIQRIAPAAGDGPGGNGPDGNGPGGGSQGDDSRGGGFRGDGLIILPGFVDLHTHLREPGGEEAETIGTGTRSAAAGGFTDVFAMANTVPVTDTAARIRRVAELAASAASARVHPIGAITTGLAGERLAALVEMRDAGARLFSDDGKCVDDAGLMFQALRIAAEHGLVLAQHAQSAQLAGTGQVNAGPVAEQTGLPPWHPAGEEAVIARDAILAGHTGAPLHVCHVSTRGSVEVVRWAKAQGYPVTCEVTPHHLLLTDELAAPGAPGLGASGLGAPVSAGPVSGGSGSSDPRYKVNPPLRSAEDVAALRQALGDGTIDAVATDHAPHTAASKARQWCAAPFGMTALETALAVVAEVLTGPDGTDWALLSRLMSGNPARIGGIAADAGRPLAEGEPATFCLVDPAAFWTVGERDFYSKSSNSPFLGATFRNRVVATVLNGHLTHATPGFDAAAGSATNVRTTNGSTTTGAV